MTHEALARELAEAAYQCGAILLVDYGKLVDVALPILTKHLAAKEPSNTLPEEVLGVLRDVRQFIVGILDADSLRRSVEKSVPYHYRDNTIKMLQRHVTRIDQLLGGDDGNKAS